MNELNESDKKINVLLEMRPALDGFAGIPQETRLLFRGLRMLERVHAQGLMQASSKVLAKGTTERRRWLPWRRVTESSRINRYSRVIISLAEKPYATLLDKFAEIFERRVLAARLTIGMMLGNSPLKLTDFKSQHFKDFVWRSMFSKTLPASDFGLVAGADQRICSVPWGTLHKVGLRSLNFGADPVYPKLDTRGVDIFIAQTPYPGRLDASTAFVVRYHDALPVFMPHTISDKSLHQATHLYALTSNVKSGAYFACVSEATRNELLKLFPDLGDRAVTIHNMVSHHYYPEPASAALVPGIVRARLYEGDPDKGIELTPKFFSLREKENFYAKHLGAQPLKYALIVSTIEPRKNHARLLAAWEVIKAEIDPDLKLVVVGTLGWETSSIVTGFREWIDRGQLFCLHAVPAPDLRVLYQHAAVTVCPSLGEGFDFSGVESMRSNGVVVASDIPVHREVYEDASLYFDPYSTASLVKAIKRVVYDAESTAARQALRQSGQAVASRYLPERILPQWDRFLARVVEEKRSRAPARLSGPAHGASDPAAEDPGAAAPAVSRIGTRAAAPTPGVALKPLPLRHAPAEAGGASRAVLPALAELERQAPVGTGRAGSPDAVPQSAQTRQDETSVV